MDAARKYAPMWALLFAAGSTLARKVGERFMLKRELRISKKDVLPALLAAAVGYAAFRFRYGNRRAGRLTR